MKVGKAIKYCRNKRKITQGELAARIESNQSYISQVESCDIDPSKEMLSKIALALDVEEVFILMKTFAEEDHSNEPEDSVKKTASTHIVYLTEILDDLTFNKLGHD